MSAITYVNDNVPMFPTQVPSATLGAPSTAIPSTPAQSTTAVGKTVTRRGLDASPSGKIDLVQEPIKQVNWNPPSQSGSITSPIDDPKCGAGSKY